ncbi:MAG: sulfurtransferase TusA family protein [Candidatus Magnetoovum sp. WYHC-5]|nr:sulfurtransferase TusA family protein [Candidatus Magnetoovum sp. WYHC-5]
MDEAIIPDKRLNLKGFRCPYTFVKSRLTIEAMTPGEVLEIIVDYEGVSGSILKSMEDHRHRVLKAQKTNETDWILLVRKEME